MISPAHEILKGLASQCVGRVNARPRSRYLARLNLRMRERSVETREPWKPIPDARMREMKEELIEKEHFLILPSPEGWFVPLPGPMGDKEVDGADAYLKAKEDDLRHKRYLIRQAWDKQRGVQAELPGGVTGNTADFESAQAGSTPAPAVRPIKADGGEA